MRDPWIENEQQTWLEERFVPLARRVPDEILNQLQWDDRGRPSEIPKAIGVIVRGWIAKNRDLGRSMSMSASLTNILVTEARRRKDRTAHDILRDRRNGGC